jgi:hypothetical protein
VGTAGGVALGWSSHKATARLPQRTVRRQAARMEREGITIPRGRGDQMQEIIVVFGPGATEKIA